MAPQTSWSYHLLLSFNPFIPYAFHHVLNYLISWPKSYDSSLSCLVPSEDDSQIRIWVQAVYLGSDPRKQVWRNGESDRAGFNSINVSQWVNYPCRQLSLTRYTLPQTCMKYTLKSAARRWGAWLIYWLPPSLNWWLPLVGYLLKILLAVEQVFVMPEEAVQAMRRD